MDEPGDQPGGGPIPVRVKRLFGGVEEDGAEPVLADLHVGLYGVGKTVGSEDVEVPALDERGQAHDIEQLPDSTWH